VAASDDALSSQLTPFSTVVLNVRRHLSSQAIVLVSSLQRTFFDHWVGDETSLNKAATANQSSERNLTKIVSGGVARAGRQNPTTWLGSARMGGPRLLARVRRFLAPACHFSCTIFTCPLPCTCTTFLHLSHLSCTGIIFCSHIAQINQSPFKRVSRNVSRSENVGARQPSTTLLLSKVTSLAMIRLLSSSS
jgi:hypothetical protein